MVEGSPAMPYFTESVIVPNQGQISLEIEHDGFIDYEDINVVPSKGHLTRNINPENIGYSFGGQYSMDEFYPNNIAELSTPFNLRNTRGVTVTVSPYQYNPVTKVLRVYSNIRTNVLINESETGVNELTTSYSQNDVFSSIYNKHYINSQLVFGRYSPLEESGDMLIIAGDDLMDEIQPLVDWKIQSGIKTTLVGTSTAGITDTQIMAYIQTFYASNPDLVYVLLVGDHDDVPSHTYGISGSEELWSDSYYGQLTGGANDYYPELFIGRFSGNSSQITTMVNRNLEYEKTPANGNWMTKAIGLASDEGSGFGDDGQSDYEHHQAMRSKLLGFGYTTVYEFYDGSQGGTDASGDPSSSIVSQAVNSGVGLFNYTGHGDLNTCITGNYSSSDVNGATNNGMYPFVISVACNNGTFVVGTCISEVWQRATHSGDPSGSIAACGSSILMACAEPMQTQDEMTEIIAESYSNNKKTSLGGIFYNSQISMLEDYNSSNNAKEVMQTWVMFGDPSTVFRNKVTTDLAASHVSNVDLGETSVNVICNVEGAKISISKGANVLGTGIVSGGSVTISFASLATNVPLIVTATKQNYKPYQGGIQVADGSLAGFDKKELGVVNVYPNPAADFVNVVWSDIKPSSIVLMDLSGKMIYSLSQNQLNGKSAVVPTSELSSGLYLLNVTSNDQVNTVKVTVK